MKTMVGSIAMLHIDGKVAEKDKDGKWTGNMLELATGEIGKVISERGKFWKDRVYTIKLAEGIVVLRSNAVSFPDEDDMAIPESVLKLASPDYEIRESDKEGEGAEY